MKKYKKRPEPEEMFSLTHTNIRMTNFADDLEKSYNNVENGEESLFDEKPRCDLVTRRKLARKRQKEIMQAQRIRSAVASTVPQAYTRGRLLNKSEMESALDGMPAPTFVVDGLDSSYQPRLMQTVLG